MRDPDRIEPFLNLFKEYWERYPDLRFGQIVYNLHATIQNNKICADLFYIEDDEMLQQLIVEKIKENRE